MKILCNGKALEVAPETRVADYIRQLDIDLASVVVECDGRVLCREEYESHELQDGAVLELIRFVGGG